VDEWIRLRATARIGAISRELEKAQTIRTKAGTEVRIATGGQPKEQQLEQSGLSVRTANRYEHFFSKWRRLIHLNLPGSLKTFDARALSTHQRSLTFPCREAPVPQTGSVQQNCIRHAGWLSPCQHSHLVASHIGGYTP
jgi:hypothetical protein